MVHVSQDACEKHGNEKVMKVIEYTPTRTSSSDDTPSLNIAEALVVACGSY